VYKCYVQFNNIKKEEPFLLITKKHITFAHRY